MISVLVPAYNAVRYLAKAIDSLLGQAVENFELILIDDGSTDQTLTIMQDYAAWDSRIRVFFHPNRGIGGFAE